MIVKIMEPAGSGFPGVQYNDKKVEKGSGELMLMKNFPSFINENSAQQEIRDYFKSVSNNERVKKPQFHAAISTKFREHTKEELTKIAENFMDELGYGQQPYIVVFHNDTENNHIHIVSTRVDKQTGKKINDSYEKLKAQKALSLTMEKLYELNTQEQIEKLLGYRYGSLKQLELLLARNGFKLIQNKNNENALDVLKNGVREKTINVGELNFSSHKHDSRAKQLRAILSKYKELYSCKVFKIKDNRVQEAMLPEEKQNENRKPKIEFESEFQKKIRDVFGVDIVFHISDKERSATDLKPFGYSLIDHKTGTVYKGSYILKMNELFEFTAETIDKKLFEGLKDYNIADEASKEILIEYLKRQNPNGVPKYFMLFETKKRKNREVFSSVRREVKQYVKTQSPKDVHIVKSEGGKFYAVHSKLHYVGELEQLIGEKDYQKFLNPDLSQQQTSVSQNEKLTKELSQSINDLIFQFSKSSGGSGKDPAEEEFKKRRKKKNR
ncbi:mobilization protein [Elizabethkingia miricola]|uniref:relaxase/mobilization nuclease domain-containing protein n=1 Tax=Weeksellaceae TaxID=2762318 RepID=UPI00099ABC6B|nr:MULTISPECIES: relaxase/mobilization nuclease domain-containing protein [Weeksellaceae]MDV3492463.1 mobilization protein [Elizabethkingia anophelis]MDV4129657.1 mobilization protein [Elizabethkingia anophelis]MDV4133345.1 mobilization protein [Elizabethkingia anophelis]OPB90064.1 mobilization protein [Elizabethkingia miricola]OPC56112.1 mobilization protein [Elizabethkingia anophelis]